MKHTPGKWIFEKQTSGYEHIKHPIIVMTEQEEGGAMVAAIYDFGAMEETKANANLIAAAPDMLETLITLRRELNLDSREDLNHLINATIAKAEGKQ